jgi:hypothetical protein
MSKKPASQQPARNPAPFAFKLETVTEVPVTVRSPNVRRPFPWDDMNTDKNNKLAIPLVYWTENRGYKGAQLEPAVIKDRIRRSFYGWQKAKGAPKERANLTIALSDQYEGTGDKKKYQGVNVYLVKKTPDEAQQKDAA